MAKVDNRLLLIMSALQGKSGDATAARRSKSEFEVTFVCPPS